MTEILRVDFHPGAQPVRCANGWLLAAHPECTANKATLLIDAAATDSGPAWHEQPDGTHRLLLMAASDAAHFVSVAANDGSPVTVEINGSTCHLQVIEVKSMLIDGYHGHSYSVLVSYGALLE